MLIVLLTIANSDGVHIVTHFFKQIRIEKNKKSEDHQVIDFRKAPTQESLL